MLEDYQSAAASGLNWPDKGWEHPSERDWTSRYTEEYFQDVECEIDPDIEDELFKALSQQVGGNHYKTLAIQPIDYIVKNDLDWCEGNVVKYITRHRQKGGKKDLEKVIHYAQIEMELCYGDDT